jgi:cytoskeletal protein CcmA (bactofilin family)
MFKRKPSTSTPQPASVQAVERITSVLGPGVIWTGSINGTGGVRIEGAFEGQIALRGMLVSGNITTQKLEIRATGRVWGDVVTTSFVTEEGAFLRGQIRMEDEVDLGIGTAPETEAAPESALPLA